MNTRYEKLPNAIKAWDFGAFPVLLGQGDQTKDEVNQGFLIQQGISQVVNWESQIKSIMTTLHKIVYIFKPCTELVASLQKHRD